jgi:acyl dehydratase
MTTTESDAKAGFAARLKEFEGKQIGPPELGADPVNQAMIRHWVEAIGDHNPVYVDADAAAQSVHGEIVAPPVMLQAWVMRGFKPRPRTGGSVQDELMGLLEGEGFTSVVATNCEQEYARYVHLGDHLSTTTIIESVSDEKATGLGVGHFVTTRVEYRTSEGELVGTMRFRILKFRPGTGRGAAKQDEKPPRPACPACRSYDWDTLEASGRGTVYSFVVNHYPQIPSFDYPLPIGLIELEEGTRLVADLVGIEPGDISIGMAVEVEWQDHDPELSLPAFKPAGS